jgi:hypothetical protein
MSEQPTTAFAEPAATVPPERSLAELIARMVRQFQYLIAADQVVEMRALDVCNHNRPHVEAGFFDSQHLEEMARVASQLTRIAKGVYFTLNPLKPDLLARRCNRVAWAKEGELAKDKDVIRRRWLLVDADPVRDSLVSATEVEKGLARQTIDSVREHLRGLGWAEPILGDSGNGYHLLYRVDLPADDGGLIERVLAALAARFDTDAVRIDRTVFNPARICKLPGTIARKGDHVPSRPHRRASLLEVPGA